MPGDILLIGIIIFSLLAAGGSLLMWRLWVSVKDLYNSNNHDVPTNMRLAFFGSACCVIVVPVYLAVHLITLS